MSAYSLAICPSKCRRYALLVAAAGISLLFLLLPLNFERALLAWLTLCVWLSLLCRLEQRAPRASSLVLSDKGAIRWLGADLPNGQLQADSVISSWLIQLSWQDSLGNSHRCCLFADQLSQSDYRTLARQLVSLKWQLQTVKN